MNLLSDIIQGLIKGLTSSNNQLKRIVKLAIALTVTAIIITIISEFSESKEELIKVVSGAIGAVAGLLGFGVKVYEDTKEQKRQKDKIETLEREVKENPTETKTSWELARLKLESYLNKNLQQVSAIFYLSASVMLVGFGLIIFGVYKVFANPDLIEPAILVTSSGVIVNFIGGTFLIIYRSTLNQARNYVEVLERINAVGMSIEILESINSENQDLKDKTTAEIAKDLLKIYGKIRNDQSQKSKAN